ncbi:hypothetical protein B0J13DRAFT_632826 [Dactylonectria estremocensis]|uniref:Uncharacterized protein n=1 Tax=Dactylonectria estremocensis TaxID=1079267 RepID=A0A9P9JD32_9HYPO|nr:hypothetical protein B0J13DRAFT_632826 [Dactylonectria estremocensis]
MSGFFTNRFKFSIQVFQVILVHAVLILTFIRMMNKPKGMPKGRASTMAMGMSAKSLMILFYEILSSKVKMFKRFKSLKAYFILNALEIVFWGAVVFLMIQANIKFCEALNCTLSWVVVGLSIFMSIIAGHMAVVTWLDWRYFKANGVERGTKYTTMNDVEMKADTSYKTSSRRRSRSHSHNLERDGLVRPSASTSPRREHRERRHSHGSRTRSHGSRSHSQGYETYRSHHDQRGHAAAYEQNLAGQGQYYQQPTSHDGSQHFQQPVHYGRQ